MRASVTFQAPSLEPKTFDGDPDAPSLCEALIEGLRGRGLAASRRGQLLMVEEEGRAIDVFVAYRGADFLVGIARLGDDALAVRVRDGLDATIRAIPDAAAIEWHEETP